MEPIGIISQLNGTMAAAAHWSPAASGRCSRAARSRAGLPVAEHNFDGNNHNKFAFRRGAVVCCTTWTRLKSGPLLVGRAHTPNLRCLLSWTPIREEAASAPPETPRKGSARLRSSCARLTDTIDRLAGLLVGSLGAPICFAVQICSVDVVVAVGQKQQVVEEMHSE